MINYFFYDINKITLPAENPSVTCAKEDNGN
jgi:hypothetical protein